MTLGYRVGVLGFFAHPELSADVGQVGQQNESVIDQSGDNASAIVRQSKELLGQARINVDVVRNDLRQAIDNDELDVHYQVQASATTRSTPTASSSMRTLPRMESR